MSSQERALLTAANEHWMHKWGFIIAFGFVFVFGMAAIGGSYYSTYLAEKIALQKLAAYKLCLENQKLAMSSAIDRRGYLSIPDCRI